MSSRMSHSRASISSQSGAAKTFEENIIRQSTESTWKSYGSFITKFNHVYQCLHDSNVKYIESINYSPFTTCSIGDDIIEDTTIFDLCSTCGNMELNKIILVFSQLVLVMNDLTSAAKDKFVAPIVVYGHKIASQDEDFDGDNDINADNGDEFVEMSEMIQVLYDLHLHINNCCEVGSNLMKQLDALFTTYKRLSATPNKPNIDVDGVRFDIVFQSLANLALSLVNLDEVMSNQETLKKDFVSYKRMLNLVSSKDDVSSFGVDNNQSYKLKALYQLVNIIERNVIDAYDDARMGNKSFFGRLMESLSVDAISKNEIVGEQFASFIRQSISDIDHQLASLQTPSYLDERRWFSFSCLYVIYVWVFLKDDRRLFKSILDNQKKLSLGVSSFIVHLDGNVSIFPENFLASKLPQKMVDRKIIDTISASRESLIKGAHYNSLFDKEFNLVSNKLNHWLINFETSFGANDFNNSEDNSIVSTLIKQMKILDEAKDISANAKSLIRSCILLHLHYQKSISKTLIVQICNLINSLKMMEISIERNKSRILLFLSSYNQYNSCLALNSLSQMKKRLVNEVKKYSEKKLDIISAVILSSNCLHGPVLSFERQILISLCLSFMSQSMNESENSKICTSFKNIESASKVIKIIKMNANTDYMIFNRSVTLGVYFNYQITSINVNEVKYFFYSFTDWLRLLSFGYRYHSRFEEKMKGSMNDLEMEILKTFKENYLSKICTEFETELRLQSHQDLQLDDQSPFKRSNLISFRNIIASDPIRLFNKFISIRDAIENYLNEVTYNLTTITLHDWKSYESMLNLAKHRFGRQNRSLSFVSSQLPSETINQGLDVLEITRNIHVFVTKYYYNLNNQMFIEKSSDAKHFNVLLIEHVSNSISTHGYGIINTAVNFSYQFLKKKFSIFSTILYQDNIKSRLIKDLRFFKENSINNSNYKFSFEKAEKFVKGIRKMGLNAKNESILDQFKTLITEIGNVLAFIRILRSGALHSASAAVNFVPDLDELSSDHVFTDLVKGENITDSVVTSAASNLDTILSTLNRNFSESTDYFQLLISVFASTLRDIKNVHLRNFHVIIPALTISHVESLIIMKERMIRSKSKISAAPTDGVAFTDDGFAVGVSYILSLLDQVNDFDSFQWFSSVSDKINKDREAAVSAASASASDSTMNQTTGLTLKRLDVLEKEFNLLHYNLISCKVLFRAN